MQYTSIVICFFELDCLMDMFLHATLRDSINIWILLLVQLDWFDSISSYKHHSETVSDIWTLFLSYFDWLDSIWSNKHYSATVTDIFNLLPINFDYGYCFSLILIDSRRLSQPEIFLRLCWCMEFVSLKFWLIWISSIIQISFRVSLWYI